MPLSLFLVGMTQWAMLVRFIRMSMLIGLTIRSMLIGASRHFAVGCKHNRCLFGSTSQLDHLVDAGQPDQLALLLCIVAEVSTP